MYIRKNPKTCRNRSTTLPNSKKSDKVISRDLFKNKVGTGLTSEVYRCQHPQLGDICIKSILPNFLKTTIGGKLIKNQIEILESLDHKNIIKFIRLWQKNQKKYIVTEYCNGGNLQQFIKNSKSLSEKQAFFIFSQILQGCIYLLSMKILHRDLKPSNILLHNTIPKIADFGFAVANFNHEYLKINAGSPLYMAPEVLSELKFSEKSEVFALGVVLYQMLTGKTPWTAASERDLLFKMKHVKPQKIQFLTDRAWVFILKCLSVNKEQRPNLIQMQQTVNQILKNSCVKNCFTVRKKVKQFVVKNENNMKDLLKENKQKNRCESLYVQTEVDSKQNISTNIRKFIKKSTVKEQKKIIFSKQPLSTTLINIKPQSLDFLPQSVILKLDYIIKKYYQIINQSQSTDPSQEVLNDALVSQVRKCQNQRELCFKISGFIRRLLRIAKNYENCNGNILDLDRLYRRVIEVIA